MVWADEVGGQTVLDLEIIISCLRCIIAVKKFTSLIDMPAGYPGPGWLSLREKGTKSEQNRRVSIS